MTVQQWRIDKRRVKLASELLATPVFREMLETVLETQQFAHLEPKVGRTDGDRSYMLGAVDGHHFAIYVLKSLGTLTEIKPSLEADYGAKTS